MHHLLRWIRLDKVEGQGRARGKKKERKKERKEKGKKERVEREPADGGVRGFSFEAVCFYDPTDRVAGGGQPPLWVALILIVGSSGALDFLRQEAR